MQLGLEQLREQGSDTPSALLAEFVDVGRSSLENLMNTVDPRALQQAVDVLARAETIHLVGFRRAFPVTSYLAYAFEKMEVPAILALRARQHEHGPFDPAQRCRHCGNLRAYTRN